MRNKKYTYKQAYGICYKHKHELGFKLPEWGNKYLKFYFYPNLKVITYNALKQINPVLPNSLDDLYDIQYIALCKVVNYLENNIDCFNSFLYLHTEYKNTIYTPSKEELKRKDWVIVKL